MAPARRGGGALKILLIVFVFFVALITIAGAGLWYAAHKVKQAAIAKVHELGVELPPSGSRGATGEVRVCELLPKEDVAKLLGKPIERAERTGGGCAYYGPAGTSTQMGQDQISSAARTNAADSEAGITDLVTNLASAAGAASGQNAAMLTVIIANDGRTQMAALTSAQKIFGGIRGAAGGEIPNLGDRAVMLAPLGLNVLQGDRIIRIVPGPVSSPKEKSIAVARAVLARL